MKSNNERSEHYDIRKEIELFRESKIDNEALRQLFTVCRDDGEAVMKADILAMYKNPHTNLLARPCVRFEGEEGVGAKRIFASCCQNSRRWYWFQYETCDIL